MYLVVPESTVVASSNFVGGGGGALTLVGCRLHINGNVGVQRILLTLCLFVPTFNLCYFLTNHTLCCFSPGMQAQNISPTMENALLGTIVMRLDHPDGLQNRLIWFFVRVLCVRGGTQLVNFKSTDFVRTVISGGTHHGWEKLEYRETHTKTNQLGLQSARKAPTRKNPIVLLDPNAPMEEKRRNPVYLYDQYLFRCPATQHRTTDRFWLQPLPKVPVVRFLPTKLGFLLNYLLSILLCPCSSNHTQ
jgi:hypothetical protein